ncbi:MAG TPA: heparinase II/III-family protein, partial [Polyangiaceae bacterium]|nr:heparinase II/III-family protein [Polyangiaceae bacterium]
MLASRFSNAFRSSVAALSLVALAGLVSACSKEEKLEQLWEGPAKLNTIGELPKAQPASKTNFDKLELAGATAKLVVPVDWKQGSGETSDWRNVLHRWEWIWPLLVAYQEKQDKESLKQATLLALDWIKADTSQGRGSEHMWEAGNAGWRAAALGYVIHAATDAKLLTVEQQQQLITSARKHAAYLANDENYKRVKDAALYLDHGLAAMCLNLNKLKDCQVWKDIARQRAVETSSKMFDTVSGVQLGRSSMLHVRSVEALTKVAQVLDDPALKKLVDQSTKATGWLVPPDGRHSLMGENSYYKLPAWAMTAAKQAQGVQLLGRSGYAAVREGDSFLLASASFYDKRRKQADDLSFVWSEQGQRILEDSGRTTSKPELSRFAHSAAAHNVVTINGKDFPLTAKPYKNGMRATGKAEGWYALNGRNPLLARNASHERTWLYRPGKLLLVIDNLETPEPEAQFDRFFHFWYERKVQLDEAGQATTTIKKTPVRIFDASGDLEVTPKIVRDQKNPVQGVMFLNSKSSKPNDVLQLSSKGQKAILVTAFVVGESKLTPKDIAVTFEHDVYYVKAGDEKLALSRDDATLAFELGVAKGESKAAKANEAKAKEREKAKAEAEKQAGAAKAAG